jgi:outer membrane receptor protein involved in Fe transport
VPGFWVESSGGIVSNNVAPRGLAGGAAFKYISVQEDGLPAQYDGEQLDSLQRLDMTIERLEAIRGGTSGILTVNGPAAIVNYITKKGTDTPETSARLTITDFGTVRPEFVHTGPLNDKWKIAAGGYYRTSDGPRDTGFTTDEGGQVRINLTRELDNGEFTLSAKYIDENNTFYLPVPLEDTENPRSIVGLDATSGTMLSVFNANTTHRLPDGDGRTTELGDGWSTKANTLGSQLKLQLNDNWSMSNNFRITNYDIDINGVFNFANNTLIKADDFLTGGAELFTSSGPEADVLLNTFAAQGATSAAYRDPDTGQIITAGEAAGLNGNGLITGSVALLREREFDQIANDLRFVHETDRNSLALGLLYIDHDSTDFTTSSTFLSEIVNNPRRLDLVALDNAGDVVGSYTDNGVLQYGTWYDAEEGSLKSTSFYINDEFQVTEDFRLDVGLRYENTDYDFVVQGRSSNQALPGALNADGTDADNVIANNTAANFGNGQFTNQSYSFSETAYTIGFNYTLSDNLAVYGRYANAFQMPNINAASVAGADRVGVEGLVFTEIGVRYIGDQLGGSVTLFDTLFDNFAVAGEVLSSGQPFNTLAKTNAQGIEWDFAWQLNDLFRLDGSGVFQSTDISGVPVGTSQSFLNGNTVVRTPETQIRLTPTLTFGETDVFLTVHHIGDRPADFANTTTLPAYTTLDLGVAFPLGENTQIQLRGSNITDEIGLTEGNPRSGLSTNATSNFVYARPIFGRTLTATLTYSF